MSDHSTSPSSPGEQAQGEAIESRRFAVLVAVVLLGLVVLHALLNRGLPAPQIHADEAGYLGDARFLASGYGQTGAGYYAGYSMLLVPAAWLTSTALSFYHAALLTNAVLAALSPLFALILVRVLFPQSARWVALITAGIVAFSPIAFSFVGLAMSENALVPATLGAAVLIAFSARSGDLRASLGAAALGVFAYWITPRGVIVSGATLAALAVIAIDRGRSGRRFLVQLLAVGSGLVLGTLFERAATGTKQVAGVTARHHSVLWVVIHPAAWRLWLGGIVGRFAYLGAATAGLTLVGVVVAGVWLASRGRARDDALLRSRRAVAVFAILALVVTVVADAAGMAGSPMVRRLDFLYYGRYSEAVGLPMVVIGAGWLLSAPVRRRVLLVTGALAGLGVGAATLGVRLLVPHRPVDATTNRLNILGVAAMRLIFHVKTLTLALLCMAALGTALLLLMSWSRRVFGTVLVVLLAGGALVINARLFERPSKIRATEGVVAQVVERLHGYGVPTDCIELDRHVHGYSFWHEYNYRFLLPATQFFRTDRLPSTPCGPLVISSGTGYGALHPTARLVAMENDTPMSLWMDLSTVPAKVLAVVTRTGLYLPGPPCARLPKTAYQAKIGVHVSYAGSDRADLSSVRLAFDLSNPTGGAPWLGSRTVPGPAGCGRVDIAATVTDARAKLVYSRRVNLPRTVMPGETIHYRAALVASGPGLARPVAGTGPYTLKLELVQEVVQYFGAGGQTQVTLR